MADFGALVNVIRRIVRETTEAHKPSGLYFGKVTSVSPIKITIDPKHVLTEEFIVLGRYITEFSVDLTIEGELWRGLRPNDELMLMREQGGQRYAVIDWVNRVDEDTRPAWIKTGEVISESPLEIKVNDYFTIREDDLIICLGVRDKHGYFSFNNPAIKQKVDIWDRAERESQDEPLPEAIRPGEEPHRIRDDEDDPAPAYVEKTTDIQFMKKWYYNTLDLKDRDGNAPDKIELPAFHETTQYHRLYEGDKVLLCNERSSRKWYVVDFVYQNMDKREWVYL